MLYISLGGGGGGGVMGWGLRGIGFHFAQFFFNIKLSQISVILKFSYTDTSASPPLWKPGIAIVFMYYGYWVFGVPVRAFIRRRGISF